MRRRRLCLTTFVGIVLTVAAMAQEPPPAVQHGGRSEATAWPTDINGDGIVDLVTDGADGLLRIRRGRGNGTFGNALRSRVGGRPVATGDFNADGRMDVVVVDRLMSVAPGRRDGILGTARPIEPGAPVAFVLAADLNSDDHLDLVLARDGDDVFEVRLVPGKGDLSFGSAVPLALAARPAAGTVADVNGDRLQDLVVLTHDDGAWLLLNRGDLAFGLLAVPSAWPEGNATAIAAHDVTGDGFIDLLFSSRFSSTGEAPWESGSISVAIGKGDGTFLPGGAYSVGGGAHSLVVGDFTHDGIADVATGVEAGVLDQVSACVAKTDSAHAGAILPGRGDGSFGPPIQFALEGSSTVLRAEDLNRDGFPDLLAGRGSTLVTGAGGSTLVSTKGSRACDERVLVASDASMAPASDMDTGAETTLPTGWLQRDIGAVGVPGSASVDPGNPAFPSSTFTVRGSGADIWGTRDEFHYVYRNVSGDFGVLVDLRAVDDVHQWTKAGLMVRGGTDPGAAHVSIFATPTSVKGLSLQARLQNRGSSIEVSRVPGAPPVSLRLSRVGATVRAAWIGAEGGSWNDLPPVTIALPEQVQIGFAVSSHVDGTIASATFFGFEIGTSIGPPERWASRDIGAVGAAGRATVSGSRVTVAGSGADIWGTSDEFHFISQTHAQGVEDDFEFTARVTDVQHVDQWTKAGLMIRTHLGASAAHASLFVTPTRTKGVAFQRRRVDGAQSVHTPGPALTAPLWLKLVAGDGAVRAYSRTSTGPWTFIGEDTVALRGDTLEVGLAVSSHADGVLAAATFDNVSIRPVQTDFRALTAVGGHDVCGNLDDDGVTIEFGAKGADIWGNADAFCFYGRPWTGDGTFTVRVASVGDSHPWAKAGLMFRETTDPGSKHVMAIVSPERGVAMQYRGSTTGISANAATRRGTAPEWLRLVRAGDVFTAYTSEDGTTWQTLGTITVPMNATLSVGLALTSHDAAASTTGVFDNLSGVP